MTRGKRIVRHESLDVIPKRKRVARRISDRAITAAIEADPDAAPIVDAAWFKRATLVMPEPKEPVTIRLDRDVVRWFKGQGRGYQTRINAVLRAYIAAQETD
jgi:uncharacterized protein (DUF4415 family)